MMEMLQHFLTEQRHEVIAFGEYHKAGRCSDCSNDVRYGVRVTCKRWNVEARLSDHWPYQRFRRRSNRGVLRKRHLRLCAVACQSCSTECAAKKSAPLHA